MKTLKVLKFTRGNHKLNQGQIIFDLPAGHSCPFAKSCQAFTDRDTGKIRDGIHAEFRCYAASLEIFPVVRNIRWQNFDALKKARTTDAMVDLLVKDLPFGNVYRIHTSGDFYSQTYFDAWIKVARLYPERTFYAYTKAIPFWLRRIDDIPKNFILNASLGGTYDNLAIDNNLKLVRVVNDESEAKALGLKVDHNDDLAWRQKKSFALVIHGNGKPNSFQAKLHNKKVRHVV